MVDCKSARGSASGTADEEEEGEADAIAVVDVEVAVGAEFSGPSVVAALDDERWSWMCLRQSSKASQCARRLGAEAAAALADTRA